MVCLARCAEELPSAQDDLQPLYLLEPLGRFQPDTFAELAAEAPKLERLIVDATHLKAHRTENMFGRLKDWRRIHTRYDRCAHTVFSAIGIAPNDNLLDQSMSPEPGSRLGALTAC